MLTEIGALVTIVKSLLDATKTGTDLFGRKKPIDPNLSNLKLRIEGIAEQLQQSVALSRMLPIWLKDHAEVDLFQGSLGEDEIRLLDTKLRNLIADSVHDHFSGTFFHTSFRELPGIGTAIQDFRDKLITLEKQLNFIPPGDIAAWRLSWPVLKIRMHDLRMAAVTINNLADEIHKQLIDELKAAARNS